jgi:hypothetical protein
MATAVGLLGQTSPPAQPSAAPAPSDPNSDLTAAREQNRRNGELLAKFKIHMASEPSFTFKP